MRITQGHACNTLVHVYSVERHTVWSRYGMPRFSHQSDCNTTFYVFLYHCRGFEHPKLNHSTTMRHSGVTSFGSPFAFIPWCDEVKGSLCGSYIHTKTLRWCFNPQRTTFAHTTNIEKKEIICLVFLIAFRCITKRRSLTIVLFDTS